MKKSILIVLIIFAAVSSRAQTKRIAYLSHSGQNLHYSLREADNLGNPIEPEWELIKEHERQRKDSLRKMEKQHLQDSIGMADSLRRLQKGDSSYWRIELGPVKPPQKRNLPHKIQPDTGTIKKTNEKGANNLQPERKQQRLPSTSVWWLLALPATVGFLYLAKK